MQKILVAALFFQFLEIDICFNESSVYNIMEDQGSATFSLVLSDPSSHNITIIVNSVDGTAIGKVAILYNNYYVHYNLYVA